MLEERGLLREVEPTRHMVPHGDRSGVVIEPYLTDQWYVDAKPLAEPALAAVREGKTQFVPENWEKTYFQWLREHRALVHLAPALVGPPDPGLVRAGRQDLRRVDRGRGAGPRRARSTTASDVALTPRRGRARHLVLLGAVAVLDPRLAGRDRRSSQRYYPTNTLVTGFDIIFFWVARMMMMGLHFMDECRSTTVFIHALVRDEKGAKMSKSKGNVIDPLD